MSKPYDINGKVALITGANRGIGKAIVDGFIQNGIKKIYAAVRKPESVTPLVEQYGSEVIIPLKIDVSNENSINEAARQASDVQVVVNNAGILFNCSPLDHDALNSLEQEMTVNVYGLIRVAQAFAPILKANGGGALVQLNSVASLRCFPPFTTYSASKAAAFSVTQGLRETLAEQGTAVISVHPGPIATDMATSAGFKDIAEPASQVSDAIIDALKTGTFLVYTDSMAREVGAAYASFAKQVLDA